MYVIKWILITLLAFCSDVYSATEVEEFDPSKEIILIADEIPPYIYINDQNEIVGTVVSKLKKVFIKAGIKHRFKYAPWNRAWAETIRDNDVLMYPLARNPEREHQFKWIIPVLTLNYKLYGMKERFDPDTVDITTGEYKFVCQETTILCTILRSFGIPDESIIKRSSLDIPYVASMLKRKRIDFLLVSEAGLDSHISYMGIKPSEITEVPNYNYKTVEYLAGNNKVNNLLIKKLRTAIEQVNDEN